VSKDGWIVLDADIQTVINFGDIKSQFGIDPACFAVTPDANHGYYSNCLATPTFEFLADFNSNGETVISFSPATTNVGQSSNQHCICFGDVNDDLICTKEFWLRICQYSSPSPDPVFISSTNEVMSQDFGSV
jgi:hypothetical protein